MNFEIRGFVFLKKGRCFFLYMRVENEQFGKIVVENKEYYFVFFLGFGFRKGSSREFWVKEIFENRKIYQDRILGYKFFFEDVVIYFVILDLI